MEERNEEISKKVVAKDYSHVTYEEIRIEFVLEELLKHWHPYNIYRKDGYKLNNIFVDGNKDLGTQGRATFILRKIPKNG